MTATATLYGDINSQEMAIAAYEMLCVGACILVRGQDASKGSAVIQFMNLVGYLDEQITATEYLAKVVEAGFPVEPFLPLMPLIDTHDFWSLDVRKRLEVGKHGH